MSKVCVAAVQMACSDDIQENIARAMQWVREAAEQGGQIILLPELFAGPYFCKTQNPDYFSLAAPRENHPMLQQMQALAAELQVVLPISFFERAGQAYFNSLVMIDADGSQLGCYRKAHIPDGPGYQEKFYFTPGDTGFQVWQTRYAKLGAAICWDQWFPEAARVMCLQGAELLFYPTAIGSEPEEPDIDSKTHWQTVMQGHAGANMTPVVVANRIGKEIDTDIEVNFYGSSFIAGWNGQLEAEMPRDQQGIIRCDFDLQQLSELRAGWGLFRDRRPGLYNKLITY